MADDEPFAFTLPGRTTSRAGPFLALALAAAMLVVGGAWLIASALGGGGKGGAPGVQVIAGSPSDFGDGAAGQSPVFAAHPSPSSQASPGAIASPPGHGPVPSGALARSDPIQIQIPTIDVASSLIPLGLASDGSLQTPTDFAVAGWWSGGPTPGETGPAVIVGHVDSRSGPAVFFRLRDLRQGDLVWVTRRDGTRVAFIVQRVEEVSKTAFPTQEVYGSTPYPALRLVTCGGSFNRSTGHYVDNIIVYAQAA